MSLETIAKGSLTGKPLNISIGGAQASTCDKRPACNSDQPIALDYQSYPHIIDRIVFFSDTPGLLLLRTTCRHLRVQVDTKRLARHVILDQKNPRLRNTHIFLRNRPELYKYTKIVDIKGGSCPCNGKPCVCLTRMIKAMEIVASKEDQPVLDFVRVCTGSFSPRDMCHTKTFQAKCTIYYVDIFPNNLGPCVVIPPLTPIGGSTRVVINFCYDSSSSLVRGTTFDDLRPVSGVQYDVLFTPSTTTASHREYKRHFVLQLPQRPAPLAGNLFATLGKAFFEGVTFEGANSARLTIVGHDQWPREWFALGLNKFENYLTKFFAERYAGWGERVIGVSNLKQRTKWERQASDIINFIDFMRYRKSWDEVDPNGFSTVTSLP